MVFFRFYHFLVLSIYVAFAASLPTELDLSPRAIPVTVEFNASCWDMTNFDGPKTTLSDILAIARSISKRTQCVVERDNDSPWYRYLQGSSGNTFADLLWTLDDINKPIRKVTFDCTNLANRMIAVANACSAMLGSQNIMFWTVLNACDGEVVNPPPGTINLPTTGQGGIAFNVGSGKNANERRLIPDLRTGRVGLPYAKVRLLVHEDESPVPGFEAYEAP